MLDFPNTPTTGQIFGSWVFDGVKWTNQGNVLPGVSLVFTFTGKPGASATILVPITIGLTLPVNLAGSYALATVAATAATVFTLYKNGNQIGTVNFAASATSGTFSFLASTQFVAGDYLDMIAPATPDGTLANIGINRLGSRS